MNVDSSQTDIIVALASPYGKSALAVIRVSGKGCIELCNRYLKRPLVNGELRLNTFTAKKFTENLTAVCYVAPHSYTGEDVVELFPHGNMTIVDGILCTLTGGGARQAERGEFTERAFMNGKLDLMQCEALADIIDAETVEQLEYGNKRYDGGFKSLAEAEKLLCGALGAIEAVLHYGDELEENEIDTALVDGVYTDLDRAAALLEAEIADYDGGRIVNDGFKVALIGAPNVGKSTLLNALLGQDRAIVTAVAGTTRDTVDGAYIYKGKKFVITDTAGLNPSAVDEAEKIGITRALKAASAADAIVYVTEKGKIAEYKAEVPVVYVQNKYDELTDVGEEYGKATADKAIRMSAKRGINVTALKQKLYDICPKATGAICNHRQYDCVKRCLDGCRAAIAERDKAEGLEIVAAALYEAYSAITELYGEQADEKVISSVFERFCVGK